MLDPAMHEQDGTTAVDGLNGISIIDDYEIKTASQDRDGQQLRLTPSIMPHRMAGQQ